MGPTRCRSRWAAWSSIVLYWISALLNLQTVNWLLRTFLPFLMFGVIVIFQSEIRKALAHLGRTRSWEPLQTRQKTEVVDEVVLAATTLSSQRTGAIVALEREIGLRSYIETGITLDAELTYDLLVNVFHPATPLHDGAVIVQGNRVAAAACFLPLTVSPELSRTLGSRHRAAIGLSEDTDAVAVVVSEETGAVSLVEDGQIRRGLDGPALRRALLSALGLGVLPRGRRTDGARRRRGRGVRLLSGETPLRVASLALAVVLWVIIAGRDTAERGLTVPVELRNVPPDLEITGDPVNTVDVRLRASPGLIESLDPAQVLAAIDLERCGGGRAHHPPHGGADPGSPSASGSSRSRRRSSRSISSGPSSKTVPVRPRILGRPARGYEVADVMSQSLPRFEWRVPRAGFGRSRAHSRSPSRSTAPISRSRSSSTSASFDPLLRLEGDRRRGPGDREDP